jgi:hypothetical protein
MFATSFRIFVGCIHGANVYVNGAVNSLSPFPPGYVIDVTSPHSATVEEAEVIQSVPTIRDPATFVWELF